MGARVSRELETLNASERTVNELVHDAQVMIPHVFLTQTSA